MALETEFEFEYGPSIQYNYRLCNGRNNRRPGNSWQNLAATVESAYWVGTGCMNAGVRNVGNNTGGTLLNPVFPYTTHWDTVNMGSENLDVVMNKQDIMGNFYATKYDVEGDQHHHSQTITDQYFPGLYNTYTGIDILDDSIGYTFTVYDYKERELGKWRYDTCAIARDGCNGKPATFSCVMSIRFSDVTHISGSNPVLDGDPNNPAVNGDYWPFPMDDLNAPTGSLAYGIPSSGYGNYPWKHMWHSPPDEYTSWYWYIKFECAATVVNKFAESEDMENYLHGYSSTAASGYKTANFRFGPNKIAPFQDREPTEDWWWNCHRCKLKYYYTNDFSSYYMGGNKGCNPEREARLVHPWLPPTQLPGNVAGLAPCNQDRYLAGTLGNWPNGGTGDKFGVGDTSRYIGGINTFTGNPILYAGIQNYPGMCCENRYNIISKRDPEREEETENNFDTSNCSDRNSPISDYTITRAKIEIEEEHLRKIRRKRR